jgi:L-methionine (R)-S-oxide reductase
MSLSILEELEAAVATPVTPKLEYIVPRVSEDGTCSRPDDLSPTPFSLLPILSSWPGKASLEASLDTLARVSSAVLAATRLSEAGWLGVYLARWDLSPPRLVKLSYTGKPSRAEFPLTSEFARGSANSTVGLSGQGIITDDVEDQADPDAPYYVCDPEVRSEMCWPILNQGGRVVGIVDAEDKRRAFFAPGRARETIEALCKVLAPLL